MDTALSTGKLYDGAGFKHISSAFAKNTVHFMGLLSDGGVHSRSDQLSVRTFRMPIVEYRLETPLNLIRCKVVSRLVNLHMAVRALHLSDSRTKRMLWLRFFISYVLA